MTIKLVNAINYTPAETPRLRSALNHFRSAVNSVQFRDLIFNHAPFSTLAGMSNKQVYDTIMSGREMGTGTDREADLSLTLDLSHSTDTIGYTYGTNIYTFKNMFQALSSQSLAGHYAHEYCHTLGFKDPDDLGNIHSNVPYEVGRIITQLALANKFEIEISITPEEPSA